MTCGLLAGVLTESITIKKPVQTFVAGTRRPVYEYQVSSTGIRAKFVPQSSVLNRNVLGQVPNKGELLFLNLADLSENDIVVREDTGQEYIVKEVKNFFDHHLEARVEEKK